MVGCFNPRTHAGCDFLHFSALLYALVSIHARFNPRTHAGCDHLREGYRNFGKCFNPRTHAGCDLSCAFILPFFRVSIHAPTRGATHAGCCGYGFFHEFQSTHPRGVRPSFSPFLNSSELFQSTHPRGVRRGDL